MDKPRRLSREESQALTRRKLLAAARQEFAREGYGGTSVEKVAEAAGYSKGAVYSNFGGKEELFQAAFEDQSSDLLSGLLDLLSRQSSLDSMIECLAAWSDERAKTTEWASLLLEQARHTATSTELRARQQASFRSAWKTLGERVLVYWDNDRPAPDPTMIGAIILELTHGPAFAVGTTPSAGDVVREALNMVFAR